jgi:lipopolysaccharide/colanic/teichoic acid biosynthesis glycosyltransferase
MTNVNYRGRVFTSGATLRGITPSKYLSSKRYISPVLAALLLLPAAGMIAVLATIIRVTSRGRAIFRQERVGKDGRTFTMYKLRTMYVGAEEETGPVWSLRHDPRTTPIGRIVRRLHLDELPQLINVIRGEMSLVGPRPERPEFVEVLADEVPGYLDRLSVLPGISGLAQIHLPPDENVDCVKRKLILDVHYIETATVLMDLRVVVCSFLRMIGLPGRTAARMVGFRFPYALLRSLGQARRDHDRFGGVPGDGRASPVSLSELKELFSGGARQVAAAPLELFTLEEEGPAPEPLEGKLQ